jgi:hypothetical protein
MSQFLCCKQDKYDILCPEFVYRVRKKENSLIRNIMVLLLALSCVGLSACKPKVDPNEPGSVLLSERCLRCHPTGINTSGRSMAEWDVTVSRMIGKGAAIAPQEKPVLVDYLSRTYKK